MSGSVASWPAHRFLKGQVRWSGTPISFRIFHSLWWSTQSKALAASIKQNRCFSGTLLLFQWSSTLNLGHYDRKKQCFYVIVYFSLLERLTVIFSCSITPIIFSISPWLYRSDCLVQVLRNIRLRKFPYVPGLLSDFFFHERVLDFVKCLFCALRWSCGLVLHSINMAYYINLLLYLIWWYFIEYICIYIQKRYW